MPIYQQNVPPQSAIALGSSGLICENAGCFVISCINILNLAGYMVNPVDALTKLNANYAYTKDGLLFWSGIHNAYPQLTILGASSAAEYTLVQGHNGNQYHWWVECAEGIFDPWTGTSQHPVGYTPTGTRLGVACPKNPVQAVQIVVASAPAPSTEFTITTNTALNFRIGPSLTSKVMVTYPAGTQIDCKGIATGDSINGSNRWCVSKLHGWYCTETLVTITNQANTLL